jgi:hypothetical protein
LNGQIEEVCQTIKLTSYKSAAVSGPEMVSAIKQQQLSQWLVNTMMIDCHLDTLDIYTNSSFLTLIMLNH